VLGDRVEIRQGDAREQLLRLGELLLFEDLDLFLWACGVPGDGNAAKKKSESS
jgi:hypothetical protein